MIIKYPPSLPPSSLPPSLHRVIVNLTGFSRSGLKVQVLVDSVFTAADNPEHCPLVRFLFHYLTRTNLLNAICGLG